jgi:hypothetical protein
MLTTQLRLELRQRGLRTSGAKKDLVARLREARGEEGGDVDKPVRRGKENKYSKEDGGEEAEEDEDKGDKSVKKAKAEDEDE